MSSRDKVLRSIRRHLPLETALPNWDGDWIQYEDLLGQFTQVLESVGGECIVVSGLDDILPHLTDRTGPGQRVIWGVPGLGPELFDFKSVHDPHDLRDVDLAIMPGQLAVAENAAIWVQTDDLARRTTYFITQQLALVVPLKSLVSNLHQAYERIQPAAAPFGCFISGPSKTADIEQSLVKGAHGARTLRVFLVENIDALN